MFTHSPGWVLRRYRDGRSAVPEGEVLRHVHALGYPVPELASVDGPDLVMRRVDGPTLAEALLDGQVPVATTGELLAGLHDRLHALAWPGGEALLHLDLHPQNVIMAPDGPVVIDWSNARPGPAGLDVAVTALILGMVAVIPSIAGAGPELDELVAAVGHELLAAFAGAVVTPYTDHLAAAVALRAADRNTSPTERDALPEVAALARRSAAQ